MPTVPTGSMENTIQPGDRLLGLRLTYLFSDPQRGDIAVFRYPVDEALGKKTNYIKRIIGLPGETVEIRQGKIYIDGSDTPLEEDYLKEEWTVKNDGFTFEVPDDCYLMLGDNRNNSSDARYWAIKALQAGVATTKKRLCSSVTYKKTRSWAKLICATGRSPRFPICIDAAHYRIFYKKLQGAVAVRNFYTTYRFSNTVNLYVV